MSLGFRVYNTDEWEINELRRLTIQVTRTRQDIADVEIALHNSQERIQNLETRADTTDVTINVLQHTIEDLNTRLYTAEEQIQQLIHHS